MGLGQWKSTIRSYKTMSFAIFFLSYSKWCGIFVQYLWNLSEFVLFGSANETRRCSAQGEKNQFHAQNFEPEIQLALLFKTYDQE
jgi:hypothetical protein